MYYILPIKEISVLDNDSVVQDANTVRYNLAKTEFIIKIKNGMKAPDTLSKYKPLTHREAVEGVSTIAWELPDVI